MKKEYRQLKKCPVSEICGACTMQGLSYAEQLDIKQKKVDDLFGRYHPVNSIVGADDPYYYRNKSQISFGLDDRRNVIAGNYVESSHIIVPVKKCQLVNEKSSEIFNTILKLVRKYHISVFDEKKMSGFLRHVLIRNSCDDSEFMVVLITGTKYFRSKDPFINELIKTHPYITTIVQSINSRYTSMVLGKNNTVLYGKGYIVDELCGYSFKLSASSFYQINHDQTEKLYRTAIAMADPDNNDTLIDAYCGIGTIGIIASRSCKDVIGVEINRQAIRDAVSNARYNGIDNISFTAEDASRFMSEFKGKRDIVVMDPPRSGCDYRFLSSLLKLNARKLVYISCNPDTQLRDVRYLMKKGYEIKGIQPFDLFPFTGHIENIILMEKRSQS